MTFNFDLHPAHALSKVLKKGYVESLFGSVVIETLHGLASVTMISVGWTGQLVLIARNPKVGLVIIAWGR